ncbi:hypothetical protein BDQ12DRAFT_727233 [Crucibulum laeve]|uniref:RBR-type E3 ubiquitin transferase n=1 Tax=Crucibulum laeve TaxID=68775 RepID=A0A5C3LLK9_9AGAR|nr:hypothetical protein BDQ12DRAFT_727233 [Crucibulum laeve]
MEQVLQRSGAFKTKWLDHPSQTRRNVGKCATLPISTLYLPPGLWPKINPRQVRDIIMLMDNELNLVILGIELVHPSHLVLHSHKKWYIQANTSSIKQRVPKDNRYVARRQLYVPYQPTPAPVNENQGPDATKSTTQCPSSLPSGPATSQSSNSPARKEKPCFDWKAGKCTRGEKCRYRHDPTIQNRLNSKAKLPAPGQGSEPNQSGMSDEEGVKAKQQEVERQEAERRARAELESALQAAAEKRAALFKEAAARREAERQHLQEAEEKARKEALQEQWEREAAVVIQQIVLDSSLVTYNAGLDIQGIVTGFELCRITITHLPRNVTHAEVADIFLQQGVAASDFSVLGTKVMNAGRHVEATVLTKAEQGEVITAGLEGLEFRDQTLHFEVSGNASWGAMGCSSRQSNTLTISWRAPSVCMVANFATEEEARAKVRALDQKTCAGRRVRVQMDLQHVTGLALPAIKIIGLHPTVQIYEVQEFTDSHSIRVLKLTNYDVQSSLDVLRQHFHGLPISMQQFDVLTLYGPTGNVTVRAQFETWDEARIAYNSIQGKQLLYGNPPYYLNLPKALEYTITIPIQQYNAQKQRWNSLGGVGDKSTAFIRIDIAKDRNRVFIKVHGDNKKAVGSLKVRVESLAAGVKLDSSYWHRSFSTPIAGNFFARVYNDTNAYIRCDWKLRVLKVFGDENPVNLAKKMVRTEVDRLASLERVVLLKRESVRFFVQKGLATLKEMLGNENATLDISSRPCKVVIRGGEEAMHHLNRLIQESLLRFPGGPIRHDGATDTCPVCFDNDISNPVQLQCGHTYCTGCIRHYLTSASDSKQFPLVCAGNEANCRASISIPVIQRFLPVQQFKDLLEVAFVTYLEQHPQEFKYCTTADCTQIYRCDTKKALQCPSCFSTICPACHEEAHEGMTCEEHRVHRDPAEQDTLNDEWASANGVKKCPQCRVFIQKTEGCNHMTCKCGAHICWRCMGVFSAARIYGHLRQVHGGIYGNEPVNPPPAPGFVDQAHDQAILAHQAEEFRRIAEWRAQAEAAQRSPAQRLEQQRLAREDAIRIQRENDENHAQLMAQQRQRAEDRIRREDLHREQLRQQELTRLAREEEMRQAVAARREEEMRRAVAARHEEEMRRAIAARREEEMRRAIAARREEEMRLTIAARREEEMRLTIAARREEDMRRAAAVRREEETRRDAAARRYEGCCTIM